MENEKKEQEKTEKKSKCKRYYWFKLYETFFNDPQIKFLSSKHGEHFIVVYLKLITSAINANGFVTKEKCFKTIAEKISFVYGGNLEETEKSIALLEEYEYIKCTDNGVYVNYIDEYVGSETDDAIRKRKQTKERKLAESCGIFPIDNGTYHTEKEKETDTDLNGDRDLERGNPFVRYGKHKMVGLTSKQYDMLLKAMGYDNLHLRIDLVDEDLYDGIAFEESSIVDIIRNYEIPKEMVGKEVQGGVGKLLRELQDDDTPIPF